MKFGQRINEESFDKSGSKIISKEELLDIYYKIKRNLNFSINVSCLKYKANKIFYISKCQDDYYYVMLREYKNEFTFVKKEVLYYKIDQLDNLLLFLKEFK